MSRSETPRMEARSRRSNPRRRIWKQRFTWLFVAGVIVATCVVFRTAEGDREVRAQTSSVINRPTKEANQALPKVEDPKHDVMAIVNGKDISRHDLIDACVRRYGEDILESLVNKRLIEGHCNRRNIHITNQDINVEIERMAKRFKLGRQQWLELLQKERGIGPEEYARDIVWPTLALRRLAAQEIEASEAELQKAIEQNYGETVRARLIAVSNAELASKLHAELIENPDRFARLAIEHSVDINSASIGGLIQPIRRHVGDPVIEREVFSLRPGQISSVLKVANQFVLLKCEDRTGARQMPITQEEKQQLVEKIKDDKLRKEAHKLFATLQQSATIQNVYNNKNLRETMPGVVATVNGDRILMKELGQECLLRHGQAMLEGEISLLLLKQELKRSGLTITQADLEAELRHAAELAGVVDEKGKADLAQWMAMATAQQGLNQKQYMHNSVWPSAALKKLTASEVSVTDEDIEKSFEANHGQRVRCRAIVLGNMRRAQEVWDKARRNPTLEFFGDLAEQYSVEPTSKALRGEVPPLRRFGGQPQLEEIAFELQPDQLSGIVQVGDKFIILRCEGRTKPVDIDLSVVRADLHQDILEKKMRVAMGEKFDAIYNNARIDNYLAGTSHAPVPPAAAPKSARRPEAAAANLHHDTAVRPAASRQ